jgi:TIR domain
MKPDVAVAQRVEQALLKKGHRVRIRVGAAVAGNRRSKFLKALLASEVFVVVLGKAAASSKHVIGEIGAARAMESTRGMLLLPVLLDNIAIPDVVNDLYCLRLRSEADQEFTRTAAWIHKAIADNIKLAPRIFISHRHVDERIATKLVALLQQAFHVEATDIRCTSVKPYMLAPGERTSEQLRSDIAGAELVIGILTPETSESNYVLCELGAAWGRDVVTFPVLAKGASLEDVPAPLNERHPISLESEDNCLDLIRYVGVRTSLRARRGVRGMLAKGAKRLAQLARP